MSESDEERHDDNEVGYKRPPEASRFKAGRSGNPNGRPKGTRNLATDLTALMEKRVIIQEDGETRQVSAQQAMLLSALQKAMSGDIKASGQIFKMLKELGLEAPQPSQAAPVTERDRAIVDDFLRRNTPPAKSESES
jgi:hypothetical protein